MISLFLGFLLIHYLDLCLSYNEVFVLIKVHLCSSDQSALTFTVHLFLLLRSWTSHLQPFSVMS